PLQEAAGEHHPDLPDLREPAGDFGAADDPASLAGGDRQEVGDGPGLDDQHRRCGQQDPRAREAEQPTDQQGRQGGGQEYAEIEEIRVWDHFRASASLARSALPLIFIRKLSMKENFRGIMYAGRRSINWTFSSEASWKSERGGRSFRITKAARESTAPCL